MNHNQHIFFRRMHAGFNIFAVYVRIFRYISQNDTYEYNGANALRSEQSPRINTSEKYSSIA